MANSVDIVVNVVTKLKDTGVEQAQGKFGKMGAGLKKAMVPAVAAIGVIGAFGAAAVESASRLEQAIGATDSVFGKNAATVKRWADDSATSVGLAKSEYLELSNVLGAQLKNMGVPMEAVAGQTKNLVTLGSDLAATFGGTTSEAVQALSSLMRGEADPIERYGVSIKQADIAAQMAADGTDKLKGEQAKAAKTQAMLTLLTKQTADAQGGFARETDTAAHAQQVAAAQYENTKATLGEALLPIMVKVMGALTKMAKIVQEHPAAFQALIAVVLALAAAIVVLNVAMLILSANPVALIIAGIVVGIIALIAVIVLCVKKWDAIKAAGLRAWNAIAGAARSAGSAIVGVWNKILGAGQSAFNWIKRNWPTIAAILTGPFGIAVLVIVRNWDRIKSAGVAVYNWIKDKFASVWDTVKNAADRALQPIVTVIDSVKSAIDAVIDAVQSLIGWLGRIKVPKISLPKFPGLGRAAAPAVAAAGLASAPRLSRSAAVPAASAGGTVIQINVTGAIDPEATARQIKRILSGHDRRTGVTFR